MVTLSTNRALLETMANFLGVDYTVTHLTVGNCYQSELEHRATMLHKEMQSKALATAKKDYATALSAAEKAQADAAKETDLVAKHAATERLNSANRLVTQTRAALEVAANQARAELAKAIEQLPGVLFQEFDADARARAERIAEKIGRDLHELIKVHVVGEMASLQQLTNVETGERLAKRLIP